jgi:pimeloyl-ACP methyl ester carboxylesterase
LGDFVSVHDVIYVPGIGDTKTTFQEIAAKTWRLWGVRPHTFPMRWADKEAFGPKFDRLLAYIDNLLAKGHDVSLVGASAGASVVLNAFAARPDIHGVVLIAGKVNRAEAIGGWYERNAPAFVESAHQAQHSLASLTEAQRARINSRYGLIDVVVPKKDSVIHGAKNRKVLSIGHVLTITHQLTFGAPLHIRFLKRLAK